jgi:hypothetical protein
MLRWTAFLALVLTMLSTSLVSAQAVPTCPMTPTISALQDCVRHASEQGHITKPGVARSHPRDLYPGGAGAVWTFDRT